MSAARSATAAFGTIVVLAALAVPGALPAAAARAAAPSAAAQTAAAQTASAASAAAQTAAAQPAGALAAVPSAASTGATGVIVQLFDWPWPAIGAECSNVLGPDGYGAVQFPRPRKPWCWPPTATRGGRPTSRSATA